MLLHELAHIRRADSLTQFFAHLICTLYWFHPLAWLALRQLRHEAERACDDLVLRAGERPSTYADALLHIVQAAPRRRRYLPLHAIAMARASHSQLHRRLRDILDPAHSRTALSQTRIALFIAAGTLVLPLAALRLAAAPASAASASTTRTAGEFPHSVPFSLGASDFLPGDRTTITSIRGTAGVFALNNTYEITGTYILASADHAMLAAFVTSLPGADPNHHDPIDPHQQLDIAKGTGHFTLVLPLLSPGHPHLSFYPAGGGPSFAALYFGAGDFLETSKTATAPALSSGEKITITVHDGKVRLETDQGVIEGDKITYTVPAPATRPSR